MSADPAPSGEASGPGSFPLARIGLWSGIGLGVANMVGVGVLTSNGYMARALSPTLILVVWVAQGLLALMGARTYAALAVLRPTSGGEYRYLSDLLHPAFGVFAGWTSLVVGFAAPVAANAFAAAAFAAELVPGLPVRALAALLVVVFTAAATGRLSFTKGTQDALVVVKLAWLGAFVVLGLIGAHHAWPAAPVSSPPDGGDHPVAAFLINSFYAAYAYAGWNAAAYAAGAFRDPARTVPRAMTAAAALVTVLYVAMAYVFMVNLDEHDLGRWSETRITMAHLLVEKLVGPHAAALASLGIVLVLVSCISAMMLTGPRVTGAMARDGFLPAWLGGTDSQPRTSAVLLQGAMALALLLTSSFDKLMAGVGVALTASSGLCALAVLRVARAERRGTLPAALRLGLGARIAAALFFAAAATEVTMAVWLFPQALLWLGGLAALTAVGYRRAMAVKARAATRPAPVSSASR